MCTQISSNPSPKHMAPLHKTYHGNLDFDWMLNPVTVVVAIDGKVL